MLFCFYFSWYILFCAALKYSCVERVSFTILPWIGLCQIHWILWQKFPSKGFNWVTSSVAPQCLTTQPPNQIDLYWHDLSNGPDSCSTDFVRFAEFNEFHWIKSAPVRVNFTNTWVELLKIFFRFALLSLTTASLSALRILRDPFWDPVFTFELLYIVHYWIVCRVWANILSKSHATRTILTVTIFPLWTMSRICSNNVGGAMFQWFRRACHS